MSAPQAAAVQYVVAPGQNGWSILDYLLAAGGVYLGYQLVKCYVDGQGNIILCAANGILDDFAAITSGFAKTFQCATYGSGPSWSPIVWLTEGFFVDCNDGVCPNWFDPSCQEERQKRKRDEWYRFADECTRKGGIPTNPNGDNPTCVTIPDLGSAEFVYRTRCRLASLPAKYTFGAETWAKQTVVEGAQYGGAENKYFAAAWKWCGDQSADPNERVNELKGVFCTNLRRAWIEKVSSPAGRKELDEWLARPQARELVNNWTPVSCPNFLDPQPPLVIGRPRASEGDFRCLINEFPPDERWRNLYARSIAIDAATGGSLDWISAKRLCDERGREGFLPTPQEQAFCQRWLPEWTAAVSRLRSEHPDWTRQDFRNALFNNSDEAPWRTGNQKEIAAGLSWCRSQ